MRYAQRLVICTLVSTLVVIGAAVAPALAIIYGSDDRKEIYEFAPQLEWTTPIGSAAALMDPGNIDASDPTDVTFNAPTLADSFGLCPSERFGSQPTPGFCSGFLIEGDRIVTAGHCVENDECQDTAFVFDYKMVSEGVRDTITTDDIYGCRSVLTHIYVNGDDLAIVELDRPVAGIAPALVRRGGLFEYAPEGPGIAVLGHPYGIPLKIADNAVAQDGDVNYFLGNVDTFGGNSGSGVFHSESKELVGILVRGNNDWQDNGTCNESVVCPDSGCIPPAGEGLEEAVRSNFLAPWVSPRCGDGLCDPGEDDFSCPADCPQDSDYDLHPDVTDNCPFAPNPVQTNVDGDPLGDACDCDPGNGDAWQAPGEVPDLRVFYDSATGWTELTWSPPAEPGATSVAYDTLRSDVPSDFDAAALCLESDDGVDLSSEDWAGNPPAGAVVYYVVRAENVCPLDGTGPVGWDSRHKPRTARACP